MYLHTGYCVKNFLSSFSFPIALCCHHYSHRPWLGRAVISKWFEPGPWLSLASRWGKYQESACSPVFLHRLHAGKGRDGEVCVIRVCVLACFSHTRCRSVYFCHTITFSVSLFFPFFWPLVVADLALPLLSVTPPRNIFTIDWKIILFLLITLKSVSRTVWAGGTI